MTEREREHDSPEPRTERLETRLSASQKRLLQCAADLQGRSLSDFVVSSAQRSAEAVIREHQVITLTAQESQRFVALLLNPPRPNDRLRAAAARYQREVKEP
jgi:uncharacterized protein (DUF1778 family)